jgi:hypothetical protein
MTRTNYSRTAKEWAVKQLGGQCVACGIRSDHIEIYDFHHTKGRKNKMDKVDVLEWFKQKIIPEDIILVCSNCHRIITKNNPVPCYDHVPEGLVFPKDFIWKF